MGKQNRRKRASTRIQSIRTKLDTGNTRERIQFFLTEYFLCEMACKEMIVGYKDAIRKSIKYENVKMVMNVIKPAINHHGIAISDDVLNRLFSSNRGSAKKLRDSLVHSISSAVIDSIITQYGQLMADMRAFLGAVT